MSTAQLQYEQLEAADRIWHLRQTPLMEGLSLSDLRAVASACTDRIYSKGETIFNQGDPSDFLFLLNRGCVRISMVTAEDREKILGVFTTGDIFGENVLEPDQYFQTQAVAHEECWVSVISCDQFIRLIEQRASIAFNYLKILNQRLVEAREDIQDHSFLDTTHRLGKTLIKLAQTHGKLTHGDKDRVKLKIFLSHEHLARLIAGNRPHVSMIMSGFKKRGWVDYQGRKLLINVQKVQQFLQSAGHRTSVS
jgi:CRP-like cAMP-binding protein